MLTVVTGSSGHVGGNLVRALVAEDRTVRAMVRQDTRAVDGLPVEVVKGDVLEPETLVSAFGGADVVYHLAARISITGEQGGLVQAVNVTGTRNVVNACLDRRVRRLVHFSSIHAFAQRPFDQPIDETRPLVDDPKDLAYDRSKAGGEREVRVGIERGLDAVIVNPTAILGPWDFKPSAMGRVVMGLVRKEFPAMVAGGFDWVDVRDVVAGAMAAERLSRTGEKYLLSGTWCRVMDLARLVEQASGVAAPRFTSPMWLARMGTPFVALWSRVTGTSPLYTRDSLKALAGNSHTSHAKAERELGYRARPLAETVSDSVKWFKENGRL